MFDRLTFIIIVRIKLVAIKSIYIGCVTYVKKFTCVQSLSIVDAHRKIDGKQKYNDTCLRTFTSGFCGLINIPLTYVKMQ